MDNLIITSVELSNEMTAGVIYSARMGVTEEEASYSFQFQNGALSMQAWMGNDVVAEVGA